MDNIALIKYLLLLITAPIWVPFVREVWKEFQAAMREDGGIFDPVPSPKKKRQLREELAREPSPQIHILKAHLKVKRPGGAPAAPPVQPGPQLGPRGRRPLGR